MVYSSASTKHLLYFPDSAATTAPTKGCLSAHSRNQRHYIFSRKLQEDFLLVMKDIHSLYISVMMVKRPTKTGLFPTNTAVAHEIPPGCGQGNRPHLPVKKKHSSPRATGPEMGSWSPGAAEGDMAPMPGARPGAAQKQPEKTPGKERMLVCQREKQGPSKAPQPCGFAHHRWCGDSSL